MKAKIAIVGTGYVGLVAATCFAGNYPAICVDVDENKVDSINEGRSPFFEPDLNELLQSAVAGKMLRATTDIFDALQNTDFVFICVGTPSTHTGACNLQYIESAARDIGKALKKMDKYIVVVQRSTVVPTTTQNLVCAAIEDESGKQAGKDFGIAFVPEFLREGSAVNDFLKPDRVIIGSKDNRVQKLIRKLYLDFNPNLSENEIQAMSIESAELVKYASNSFLATKISFANEIASLAEQIPGVDVQEVMHGVGLDHRICQSFFNAGAGWGGSCFPKDVKALIHFARTHAFTPLILEGVVERNHRQITHVVDLIENAVCKLHGKRIAILGLSFKPNTSDMRDAPSIKIIGELIERGAGAIIACDPQAVPEAQNILGERILYTENPIEALADSDIAVVLTEWDIFKQLTPQDFVENMRNPVIVDARRIYNVEEFSNKLTIIPIGYSAPKS